ncbi:auxin response factor 19-like [Nymphaea colorata]|uniref:auxin response factor 19-like n=1 Tax=Nymphaea colorata TaxID=210225 RepID=UPI00129ED36F|nr:auxin response factor 19-like [Nymphaea colorata]XP_031482175.1 auxin response factor 19-like [Nymphaea colorata]
MPWLTDDIGIKDVQNPIQHGMSLVQWMNMQQNLQILGSVIQADCFPSMTPSQLHNVGVDDPSKQLALQGHVLPLSNLQFGLPNLQQQTQQLDSLQQQNRTLANPFTQTQKPGIAGQQLQQQQQQLQQQQQQQVSQAALQCLISQPLTQSQLQNQLLQQNLIQSKLQQQQLLGVNQQQLLLSNQNPLQSSLLQQSLQLQKQIPEQQQSVVQQQQQQQQQFPLAANRKIYNVHKI